MAPKMATSWEALMVKGPVETMVHPVRDMKTGVLEAAGEGRARRQAPGGPAGVFHDHDLRVPGAISISVGVGFQDTVPVAVP
jgi:hypothetical protein